MGAEIKWEALDDITEMLGIDDVETFIAELVTLSIYQHRDKDDDGSSSGLG